MEQEIIKYYQEGNNINDTLKKFNIGKIKLKRLLLENDIPIRNKGGQIKKYEINEISLSNKLLKCKITNKIFDDVYNKSGIIIKHLIKNYKDISIPSSYKRREYLKKTGHPFYIEFFEIIDKLEKKKLNCPDCDWSTYDTTNKTGALTKHIENKHDSVDDFTSKHPELKYLFSSIIKKEEMIITHSNEDMFITCEICEEKFKTITNTHLLLHNTTLDGYIIKYGNNIISKNLKLKYQDQLRDIDTSVFYRSNEEKEIEEFIKTLKVNYKSCDKKILNGTELDFYFPDHQIAIEYNGLYWHSEKNGKTKNYHLDKTEKCLKKNIHLIHIFSDQWGSKKEIIKNRIKNLFKLNNEKIYARKCVISEISQKEKSEFLNTYHLQGNDKSSIYYGLKYKDTLVAVMSFGKKRKSLGSNGDGYELYRYASNNVIGGFTKMINYFIKKFNPTEIITYADRNWSSSDEFCFYGKVGFDYIGKTKPNYHYLRNYKKRLHRFNFRKDILVKMGYDINKSEIEIMNELGYDRIWDTGNLKYRYNLFG
jgi:hypothetical protein